MEDVIKLERNDAKMFRWTYNVRPGDRIPAEEFRSRLKLNSMREVYRIKTTTSLVIWKEWKRMFGLVNVEPLRLVVVSPEDNLEKHGVTESK